jgi:hypothetical protein
MAGKYHKREKRPCICGTRLGPENFGICKQCVRETACNPPRRLISKEKTKRKHQRVCKGCGVEFSDRCRSYCTDKCRSKHVSKPIQMQCGYCGKEIWKRCRPSEQIFKARFCNGKCQRAYRTRLSHEVIWAKADWVRRSQKAKAKWRKINSANRRRTSPAGIFLSKIATKLSSVCYVPVDNESREWKAKINSRLGCRGKAESVIRTDCQATSIEAEIRRIENKERWHLTNPWRKKIGNKLSNLTSRLKRKGLHEGKRQSGSGVPEDRAVAVQMRFERMANIARMLRVGSHNAFIEGWQ